jgi:regulator of protease activity HflC (stomatin/prohibitin superfamily)
MARANEDMTGLIVKLVLGFIGVVVMIVLICNMVTTVNADEIVIKQDVMGGNLNVWDTPGVHWQNFGTVTRYKRSAQLWFSAKKNEGKDDAAKEADESIKVRFNDGGHGNISGSLRYTLPTNAAQMIDLHRQYHNQEEIDHALVRQVVNKSVFMSGPLMSSRESYAEKRADLINFITDQIEYGVYRTEHSVVKTNDPLTGQEKEVDLVRPLYKVGAPNGIERQEESPIQKFGMSASNITINAIDYDETVEKQIQQQQGAIMAVQQAIVNAKKAEQDTLTVEQQGKAEAAKAKWAQEVEKATSVTAAEKDKAVAITQATKDKEVAALSLETAKLAAQQTITEARADSDAKKLAVVANNNLQDRLKAYVEVNKAWAAAAAAQRQTPDVVMGGNSVGSPINSAMEALSVKAMRDLQVSAKPQ